MYVGTKNVLSYQPLCKSTERQKLLPEIYNYSRLSRNVVMKDVLVLIVTESCAD